MREQRLAWIEVPMTIRYTEESLAKGQWTGAAFGLGVRLILETALTELVREHAIRDAKSPGGPGQEGGAGTAARAPESAG
jgi:hypothetical protein